MNSDSLDASLKLVANRHRRRILEHIRHKDSQRVWIDTLVERLYRAEPGDCHQLNQKELTMQLTHTHLPKLGTHGIIEYDQERGTITYRADERIESVLDSLPTEPLGTQP